MHRFRIFTLILTGVLCALFVPTVALAQEGGGFNSLFSAVLAFAGTNWDVVLAVVGLFALIATRTPNTVDNKVAQVLADIVNFLGANIGKAKNDPSV